MQFYKPRITVTLSGVEVKYTLAFCSGKVNLYKGKELFRKNILTENAVEEMINLIKENNQWVEEKKIEQNVKMNIKLLILQ